MRRHTAPAAGVIAVAALALTACGSDADGGSDGTGAGDQTITVMYQRTEGVTALENMFARAKEDFEAANDGVTIRLQPVEASEDDYATQLALAQQSASTAPDVFYEDTFRVRSDVAAGYLLALDDYLAEWDDWENFNEAAREAGRDGDSIYAIPLGTDTRGIWYSEPVLEAAGVELPWQPETWQDILDTAAQIQASDPDVVPFHMYAGKPAGEGTVMQSFLPLLYGTGDSLYDDGEAKWIIGSQGFVDALAFLDALYDSGYSVPVAEALDGNLWQTFFDWRLPDARMGGVVEGSYGSSFWAEDGPYPWAEFSQDIAVAGFPTQDGGGDGWVSMSGGWTLAIGAQSENPDLAFQFLTEVFSFENNLAHVIEAAKIAVRDDVAQEESYLSSDPYTEFFTELVSYSHYRPATADYPQISAAIQEATESVVTGAMSPEQAAAAYDQAVIAIVGQDNVIEAD